MQIQSYKVLDPASQAKLNIVLSLGINNKDDVRNKILKYWETGEYELLGGFFKNMVDAISPVFINHHIKSDKSEVLVNDYKYTPKDLSQLTYVMFINNKPNYL